MSPLRANVANEVDEIVIDKPTLSPCGREERKMENRRHAKHTFRFDVDNGQPPDVPFFPLRRYASAVRENKSRRLLLAVNSKS